MSPPMQELPTAYKLVRLYCLPLCGRRGHVPALHWLLCLSWCVLACHCEGERGCAAVREEGALRMRHSPCTAVGDEGAIRLWRAPCGYYGCNLVQEVPIPYRTTAGDCRDQCAHRSRNDKWGSLSVSLRGAQRRGNLVQEVSIAYKSTALILRGGRRWE